MSGVALVERHSCGVRKERPQSRNGADVNANDKNNDAVDEQRAADFLDDIGTSERAACTRLYRRESVSSKAKKDSAGNKKG